MDKTIEKVLKLLDKSDDLNAKARDLLESYLDEYENDDSYEDTSEEDFEDQDEEDSDEE
jgi:hypothetical protein